MDRNFALSRCTKSPSRLWSASNSRSGRPVARTPATRQHGTIYVNPLTQNTVCYSYKQSMCSTRVLHVHTRRIVSSASRMLRTAVATWDPDLSKGFRLFAPRSESRLAIVWCHLKLLTRLHNRVGMSRSRSDGPRCLQCRPSDGAQLVLGQ